EELTLPQTLYIPKGSSKSALEALRKSGIPLDWRDEYLVKLIGYPQAGWIDLGATQMRRGRFLYTITHAKAALRKVTLIPGETTEIFFREIAKSLDLNVTKLHAVYARETKIPEGVLLAESYRVPKGIDEEGLVTYLLRQSLQKHREIAQKGLGHYHEKEWFGKYVTIASIIQKEAADTEEMPLVSAVIYNRLKRKMKLQMDGTLNYGKYSHVKVTPQRIRDDNSSYNTYKIAALPPAPVCTVSIAALEAAMHPAKVQYLYFVKGKNGRHRFTNSYKAHMKAIPR
ncbi:MAG TPA: endolytic transglycosylase MltG, partial [Campylobacteraceae bacterium]|nr:endolytic transglycosylase MltG [Campylobacteraceae bacterium]